MSLFITLIVGLFTLMGSIIVLVTKNNKKIVNFSISIGFGVLVALIIMELIPELFELLNSKLNMYTSVLVILLLIVIGVIILKVLDRFIPDHDYHDKDSLIHVGIITSLALFIHNFLEGMAIYTSINTSIKFGSLLGLGVAMHNIPLGMSITSFSYKKGVKHAMLLSLLVSLSTFFGGLVTMLASANMFDDFTRGIILSITLGMLTYIVLFELLPHLIENKNKKSSIIGVLIGILILIISMFF